MSTSSKRGRSSFGTAVWILFLILLCSNLSHGDNPDLSSVYEALKNNCLENAKFRRNNDPCPQVKKCPAVFDKFACWHETCPTKTRKARCPELFFYTNASITGLCDSDSRWNFSLINTKKCTKLSNEKARQIGEKIYRNLTKKEESRTEYYQSRVYVIFSWVSFSFMVPSLIIIFYFMVLPKILGRPVVYSDLKQNTHCLVAKDNNNTRFNLHKNLICAFLLRIVTFFVDHYGNLGKTSCNVFWVFNRYFAVSEVTWMLNEALFLLKLLFRTFDAKSYFWCFFAFGWGFPAFLTFAVYVPVMFTILDQEKRLQCWTKEKDSYYMFVLYGPMTLMLLINFGTLIYVIYILLQKLRISTTSELLILKKGIKAALILMPLLGVIYLMILYIPRNAPEWFNYLVRILYPTQGILACLVYVVFNGEVRKLMKSRWNRWNAKSEFADRVREKSDWLNPDGMIRNQRENDLEKQTANLKSNKLLTSQSNQGHLHVKGYNVLSNNASAATTPLSDGSDQAKQLLPKRFTKLSPKN